MKASNLAMGLAIIGVASAVLLRASEPQVKSDEFEGGLCSSGLGGAPSTDYCTAEPVDDDVVATDPSDGGGGPAPSTGGETPMSLRGTSLDPAIYT